MQGSLKATIAAGLAALSATALTKDSADFERGNLPSSPALESLPFRLPFESETRIRSEAKEFARSMDSEVQALWQSFESSPNSDPRLRAEVKATLTDQDFSHSLGAYQNAYHLLGSGEHFESRLLRCEAARTEFRRNLETAVKEYRLAEVSATRFACADSILWNTLICHSFDFSGTAPKPEYRDALDRLRLNAPNDRDPDARLWHTHAAIANSVPEYTRVSVFASTAAYTRFSSILLQTLGEARFSQVSFETVNHPLFRQWAQDTSEGDARLQRTPLSIYQPTHYSRMIDNVPVTFRSRSFVSESPRLLNGAVELPVIFQGGNVFVAETASGAPVLLVGSSEFVLSQDLYQRAGLALTEDRFCAELSRTFDIADVRIIGPRDKTGFHRQPQEMFHLDQALLPLAPGELGFLTPDFQFSNLDEAHEKVVFETRLTEFEQRWNEKLGLTLERKGSFPDWVSYGNYPPRIVPIDPPPDYLPNIFREELRDIQEIGRRVVYERDKHRLASVLADMRSQLHDFSCVPLTCSSHAAFSFRFPTNAIVFTNSSNGEPTILMPIYPDLPRGAKVPSPTSAVNSMSTFDVRNAQTLQGLGFTVLPVLDYTDGSGHGSIHCLTGRF